MNLLIRHDDARPRGVLDGMSRLTTLPGDSTDRATETDKNIKWCKPRETAGQPATTNHQQKDMGGGANKKGEGGVAKKRGRKNKG